MATSETLSERVTRYGKNCYVEVARKRVTHAGTTREFLIVTRGFCDGPESRRTSRSVNVPAEPELREWLVQALLEA